MEIEPEVERRNIIKLGSKLGDQEDIKRRKELSKITISNSETVWKNKWKTKLKTRLYVWIVSQKYTSLQLWYLGIIAKWPEELNSLHRIQLRRVSGIKWPHRTANKKLYQVIETESLSITIKKKMERRWKPLGHILQLPADCPASKGISYFFEEWTNKTFVGRRRTTIVTTINEDIRGTKQKQTDLPITPLISLVSLQNNHTKAKNRKLWQKFLVK